MKQVSKITVRAKMHENEKLGLPFNELLELVDKVDPEILSTEFVHWYTNIDESTRPEGTMGWDNLLNCSTKLLDYKQKVTNVIHGFLGYYPDERVLVEHEFYLRSLLASCESNITSFQEQSDEILQVIRKIRNQDIRLGRWDVEYCSEDSRFQSYRTDFIYFADKARSLLTKVVGFEPELAYSLRPELIIRHVLSDETTTMEQLNETLNFCGWVTAYRRTLFEQGRAAANALPLMDLIKIQR